MKHNWEYIKLGAGCVPKKQIKRATKHFKTDDLIEYIDISSIDRLAHRISSTNSYIFAEAPSRAQQCVENNDVLVSLVRPNLKNVAIINDDRNNLIASSGFCILRGKTLIPKFVYYIATSSFFTEKLVSKCAGAAYPAVNEEDVRNILIPQPYKDTQEKIVSELDEINEIISNSKEAICNLDSLAQSLFYDYFGNPITNPQGWPTMNFGDLALSINYGTSLPATECGKYPYIRMNNLTDNGYLDLSSLKYIDIPDSELDKYLAQKGDILFNRTNSREKVGKTALFDRAEEMVIAGYIIRVRVKEESLHPVFAVRYMNLPELKKLLRKICRGAVNQANINSKEMASIPFIVPPLSLQEKFASRIEQIEQQKKDLEDTIANMQTLLDSRMDYWFG